MWDEGFVLKPIAAQTGRSETSPHHNSRLRFLGLNRGLFWILLLIAVAAWSLVQAGVLSGNDLFNPRGLKQLGKFVQASIHPELSTDFLSIVFDAAAQTVSFAVLGTLLSILIGLIGGLFSSEVWWKTILPRRRDDAVSWFRIPWLMIRATLTVPRAIHEIVLGMFLLNILGLNPLAAILALGVHFGAVTAKVISEILDETPRVPFDALRNSGAPPLIAFLYGLLPQAMPNLIAYLFYRFEAAIRASAILGIIGAGGLGYQIFLSLQSLRYEQLWTLFYALVVLCGVTDVWSSAVRHSIKTRTGDQRHSPTERRNDGRWLWRGTLLACGGLLIFSVFIARPDLGTLTTERTRKLAGDMLGSLFPPRLTAGDFPVLADLSGQTLSMSILAMILASGVGILSAFPAARNVFLPGGVLAPNRRNRIRLMWSGALFMGSRIVLLFLRAIPTPIWALVVMFVVFPGILPGALALAVATSGILGRQLSETVENLEERPLRALRTAGAPGSSVFLYGLLPSALPQFLTYILYRWEVCIRETVIVGFVGAGGLGLTLTEQLNHIDYHGVLATLMCIVGLTFIVDLLSNLLRRTAR